MGVFEDAIQREREEQALYEKELEKALAIAQDRERSLRLEEIRAKAQYDAERKVMPTKRKIKMFGKKVHEKLQKINKNLEGKNHGNKKLSD